MYQNVISIFIDCLLKWDPDKQEGDGSGILGDVIAFAPAHEEQARYTLHSHWQIWVKQLSNKKRLGLWASDPTERERNRAKFYEYVDSIMKASYTTPLTFEHDCKEGSNNEKRDITQCDTQIFRDARHQTLCFATKGQLLQCHKCKTKFAPTEFVENTLRDRLESYGITQQAVPRTIKDQRLSMISDAQLDAATFTHVYDFYNECTDTPVHIANTHWGDEGIRTLMLQHRFEYHCMTHRHSCFKKGCECRFFFPFIPSDKTFIDQDESPGNNNSSAWHRLSDPHVQWISPWMLVPKREIGSEYINTFNCALSELFNCNTNVQIGDVWQVYYSTLYGSKSTQKEDSERIQRIIQALVYRLSRIEEDIMMGRRSDKFGPEDSFTKALCVMLSGLRAATSRHVVSATMAHLLISLDGHRFQFSHRFGHLLISQLEATLEGNPTDCRLRSFKINGQTHFYGDSASEDYIYRPRCLEDKCAYYMSMWYKKTNKTKKEARESMIGCDESSQELDYDDSDYISDTDEVNDDGISKETNEQDHDNEVIREEDDEENEESTTSQETNSQLNEDTNLEFIEGHEARMFTKLSKLKQWVVPMMFYDGDRICKIELLDLGRTETNPIAKEFREEYAKTALMMFYPFRDKADLMINNSHWILFEQELNKYNNGEPTVFWKKGFEILQNIEDRKNLQHNIEKREDKVTRETRNRLPMETTKPFQTDKNDPDPTTLIP